MLSGRLVGRWNDLLAALPSERYDLYHREEYVAANAGLDAEAVCYVFERDTRRFLLPFLRRPLPALGNDRFDFETPYGYGGPVSSDDDPGFLSDAARALVSDLAGLGGVCGFLRFHPLLGNARMLDDTCTLRPNREVVVLPLDLPGDRLLREEVHQKHRNAIHQARRKGVRCVQDPDLSGLPEFEHLYEQTMRRLGAAQAYYFPSTYFRRLAALSPHVTLFRAVHEGNTVAAALFLHWHELGSYHLAGSVEDHLDLRPNHLLLYDAALELQAAGVRRLNLGGGTRSGSEDGLFRFKRRFSRHTAPFFVGELTLDLPAYTWLVERWERHGGNPAAGTLFQRYRHGVEHG
ncbi:MAG: hypothetical protein A2284_17275 [Deltaproteobacteria bacterium RIFOXYA12_FULL_61_11]|nr:MAG: hypothetical protein A2284_17275 [Deltaproteobacteria bacterium RIFOXYA12_FULL_61_11]